MSQLLSKEIRQQIEKTCFFGLTQKVRVLICTAVSKGETPEDIEAVCKRTLVAYGLLPSKAAEIANRYLQAAHYVKRVGASSAGAIAVSDHPETPGHAL